MNWWRIENRKSCAFYRERFGKRYNLFPLTGRGCRKYVCVFLARRGGMVHEARQAVCVGREQLKESMEYMSNYSRYAYEQEIKQGFLTIRGGHRVGLAGRIIQDQQHIKGMQYISCLNIRLAHEVIGCADRIFPYLQGGDSIHNTLILSPPCGGKTTLLRDIIRILSSGITEGVRG